MAWKIAALSALTLPVALARTSDTTLIGNFTGHLVPLTPTTNAQGSSIFVTENLSVSHSLTITETLYPDDETTNTVASGLSTTTVSRPLHGKPTITKYITETVTEYHHRHSHGVAEDTATVTVVNVSGRPVTITSGIQTINNHTVVKVIPQSAVATLIPLAWDPRYAAGWEHILEMEIANLQNIFNDLDWDHIATFAFQLRKHDGTIDPVVSIKFALILLLRSGGPEDHFGELPRLSARDDMATATVIQDGPTHVLMTQPTQTVGPTVYVQDPLNTYRMYDPWTNAVAPTGACDAPEVGGPDFDAAHFFDAGKCEVQRCMWINFMKPMTITTVMPMMMYDHAGLSDIDYFTRVTQLTGPHWGTSNTDGLYYPTTRVTHLADGTLTAQIVRATPDWDLGLKVNGSDYPLHGDPECWDVESCHGVCRYQNPNPAPFNFDTDGIPWSWVAPLIAAATVFLLLLLCCCCYCRRKRDDPDRKESITEKIRRKSSTKPEVVVVNEATGTATDVATGQPVDPVLATAAIAGPAAGAEAVREKKAQDADDGKGTTARRAEEGRGRVNFEDGTRPGNDPPATTTQVVEPAPAPAPEPEVHADVRPADPAETKPPGQSDGTNETSTGRYLYDTGSMRGRKRTRGDGPGMGLNLGF